MFPMFGGLKLWGALGGVLLAAAIFGFFYHAGSKAGTAAEHKRAEKVIAPLRADLAQCNATKERLSEAVNAYNSAVDDMKREADERVKKAEAAAREARRERDASLKRAERISRAQPTDEDLCKAADELITKVLGEER